MRVHIDVGHRPEVPVGHDAEPAFYRFPARFARRVRQVSGESGDGEIVVREVLVVDGDGGGHDTVAVVGDPVAAGAWDLGDESVAAEFDDES
jgi:hypothetical protein